MSSYWNHTGRFQKEYEELKKELVPNQGDAPTDLGQLVRFTSNIYYDIFNNGGCNLKLDPLKSARSIFRQYLKELKEQAEILYIEDFGRKLQKFFKGNANVADDVVDVVIAFCYRKYQKKDNALSKFIELIKAAKLVADYVRRDDENHHYEGKNSLLTPETELGKAVKLIEDIDL